MSADATRPPLFDLHSHSTASDGTLSPEALAARAAARGVKVWALTDHDTVSGLTAARQACAQWGIRFIPGVEISVSFAGETVHIVGLGIDEHHPELLSGLESVRSGRIARGRAIAEALERCGFPGAYERALSFAAKPETLSRSHFARFLVDCGAFPDVASVFQHYLSRGKPGYVPHEWAVLEDAVRWIRVAGGVAVLAHPQRYRLSEREWQALLDRFVAAGGEGLEVASPSHDAAAIAHWASVCRRYGLKASAGSDFHAPAEGRWDLGEASRHLPAELPGVGERFV